MSAFIQGTQTVGISGGNFRQSSHHEQHEHQTRVFREDKTVILGNIYGYTHSATSDSGPIIAYSHTTNITRPQYDDGNAGLSLPSGGQTLNDTPLLGDGTPFHNRELTDSDERRPAFLLEDTQHQTSEPLSYPGIDNQVLNAEFHTMSPEMQRYVRYMLGQVEKRKAASNDSGRPTMNAASVTRGSSTGLADQRPIDIHSKPTSRDVENSISNKPITSSPQIAPLLSGHGVQEQQSLPDAKPSTATNNNSVNYIKGIAPDAYPKASLSKSIGNLIGKARSLSKIFTRPVKSR